LTTTRRHAPPALDDKLFQEGVADLKRVITEGDNSDTSWQAGLPEIPAFPATPEETVAVVIRRASRRAMPIRGLCRPLEGRRRPAQPACVSVRRPLA
jgi:hypothetical protein